MSDANIISYVFQNVGYNALGDSTFIGIGVLIFSLVGLMYMRVGKFPTAIVMGLMLIILGLTGYLPLSVLAITGLAIAGYSVYAIYNLFEKR